MTPNVSGWLSLPHTNDSFQQLAPLVLVNGLAEQSESWFANRAELSRQFDVKVPEILVYNSQTLHDRIDSGGEITIDYLASRLARFLDDYVQRPPYYLVGSSLGCQVILTYATQNSGSVSKLALICPSGFQGTENLPIVEGVSRTNYDRLVGSAFHLERFASPELVQSFSRKFQDRKWKKGVLRTLRGTLGHSVAQLLPLVTHPTLVIWGAEDRVLSDVPGSVRAAEQIRRVRQVVLPKCGHAPQIEEARLVNRLISRFFRDSLRTIPAHLDHRRFLDRHATSKLAGARALATTLSLSRQANP